MIAAILVLGLLIITRFHGGSEARKVKEIGEALDGGPRPDYVAAIAAVRRAEPGHEGDVQVASLTLQALADHRAATRPVATVESALRSAEAAAAANPARDGSVIEATMRYGVADPRSGAVLLPPNLAVADCWRRVTAKAAAASACIDLRRHG